MLYLERTFLRTFLECGLIKSVILQNVLLNFGSNNQHGFLLI